MLKAKKIHTAERERECKSTILTINVLEIIILERGKIFLERKNNSEIIFCKTLFFLKKRIVKVIRAIE